MADTSGYGTGLYGLTPYGIDRLGCLITPISPTQNEANVALDSDIVLSIEDEDTVVEDTIVVEVDKGSGFEDAFRYADSPQFKPGWDGPGSGVLVEGNKYTITIDPTSDLDPATVVQVRVTAADPTGNPERLA